MRDDPNNGCEGDQVWTSRVRKVQALSIFVNFSRILIFFVAFLLFVVRYEWFALPNNWILVFWLHEINENRKQTIAKVLWDSAKKTSLKRLLGVLSFSYAWATLWSLDMVVLICFFNPVSLGYFLSHPAQTSISIPIRHGLSRSSARPCFQHWQLTRLCWNSVEDNYQGLTKQK